MKVLNIPNAMWLMGKPFEIEAILQKVEKDPSHSFKVGELENVWLNLMAFADNPNASDTRALIRPMLNIKDREGKHPKIPAAVIDIHGQTYVLVKEPKVKEGER